MTKEQRFEKAPNYKASPQDIKRMEARKKAERIKEALKFRKEFDSYY